MDQYFTTEKIRQLVTKHNWELVHSDNGLYKLRQKDKHYMTTRDFEVSESIADPLMSMD